MQWSSFAAQIIETSGSHDTAEIEDPHGWLAWDHFSNDFVLEASCSKGTNTRLWR